MVQAEENLSIQRFPPRVLDAKKSDKALLEVASSTIGYRPRVELLPPYACGSCDGITRYGSISKSVNSSNLQVGRRV